MRSNRIYKLIISLQIEEIDINTILNDNFDEAVKGIFQALYELLRNYNKNKEKIIYLLNELEKNIKNKKIEELSSLAISILEFNSRIAEEFTERDKRKISTVWNKINIIENNIYSNTDDTSKYEKIRVLEYTIYKDKNIHRLKILLETYPNILKSSKYFNDSFLGVLRTLTDIDPQNKEIDYYYTVVLFLMSKMDSKTLKKNKQDYLTILTSGPNRKEKYIKTIISVLTGEYKENSSKLEKKYGITCEYPKELETYSYILTPTIETRNNLINQNVITIDSTNTERIDDGIYIERNSNGGYYLYIHITDIPSIIPFDSIITGEAYSRAENIYFRDGIMNIYPEYISTRISSLVPNNKRNVVTFKVELDNNMNYIYDTFEASLSKISVHKKMDYNEVNTRLYSKNNCCYEDMLKYLFLFAIKNLKTNDLEVEYLLSNQKEFNNLLKKNFKNNETGAGQIMVQECMKTIGYLSARLMNELELPFLYKSYHFDTIGIANFKDLMDENKTLKKDPEFITKMLRSYQKSYYASVPKAFNGYECYAGVTDPLWKYADAYNLYMIHDYLLGNKTETEIDFFRTKRVANALNRRILRNEEFKRLYELDKTLSKKGNSLRKKL